jgi:V/A-type H+-transporting ATPase subunit I
MANARLKLFRINSDLDNLEKVLEKFVDLTCIYPVKAYEFVSQVHGLKSMDIVNPYEDIEKQIRDLEKENDIEIPKTDIHKKNYTFERIHEYVTDIHERLKKLNSYKRDSEEIIRKYKNALTQVKNIESLDISLDDLFSCEYINSRFGRMPIDSLEKLAYYDKKPFIFQVFHEEKKYCWCMYLSTEKQEREIDNIFSGLFFERIHIPDFVHGTPEKAQASLLSEISVAEENLRDVTEKINEELKNNIEELTTIKGELIFINKVNEAKKYVVSLGDTFIINGFVRTKDVSIVKKQFEDIIGIELKFLPSDSDKRLKPPTKLRKK